MANIERWKPNKEVDPKYPYHCRRNDDGRIVYSVPMEAPNDIPADMNDEGADRYDGREKYPYSAFAYGRG